MGVRLFTKYLKQQQQQSSQLQTIDLIQLARASIQQTGQPLVILVDALSLCYTLVSELCIEFPTWATHALPQFDLAHQRLKFWHESFLRFGIELRYYFDSSALSQIKTEEKISRHQQTLNSVVELNQYFNGTNPTLVYHNFNSIHPTLLSQAFMDSLQIIGAKVVICVGEADPMLGLDACIATQKPGVAPVYGVLSSDSDFGFVAGIRWLPLNTLSLAIRKFVDNSINTINFAMESAPFKRNNNDSASAPTPKGDIAAASAKNYSAFDACTVESIKCLVVSTDLVCQLLGNSIAGVTGSSSSAAASSPTPASPVKPSTSSAASAAPFPAHRLSELAILCGNDYTKGFMDRLDTTKLVAQDTKWTKELVQQSVEAFIQADNRQAGGTKSQSSPIPGTPASSPPPTSGYIKSPDVEVWAAVLKRFESIAGPQARLETHHPLFVALVAVAPDFGAAIEASRQMYDRAWEYVEVPSFPPGHQQRAWQSDQAVQWITAQVKRRALPLGTLAALWQPQHMASIPWERLPVVDVTGGFFSDNKKPYELLLPPHDTITLGLRTAQALLLGNRQAAACYGRRGLVYTRLDASIDGLRAAAPQQVVPVFARLLDIVFGPMLVYIPPAQHLPPMFLMDRLASTVRWSLLEAVVFNPALAQIPIVKQPVTLEQELANVTPDMRFIILLGRYVINAFYYSDVDPENPESLCMDDPVAKKDVTMYFLALLQVWMFLQRLELSVFTRSAGGAPPSYMVTIHDPAFDETSSSLEMATFHFLSLMQSVKKSLNDFLLFLQLAGPRSVGTAGAHMPIFVPTAATMFHGPLFAYVLHRMRQGGATTFRLTDLIREGLVRVTPCTSAPVAVVNDLAAQMAGLQVTTAAQGVHQSIQPQLLFSVCLPAEVDANFAAAAIWSPFRLAKHVNRNHSAIFAKMVQQQQQQQPSPGQPNVATVPGAVAVAGGASSSSSSSSIPMAIVPQSTAPVADAGTASDGGFKPIAKLDKLPIDVLLPTIYKQVSSEPLTIVQAATGSGKSSRIPPTLLREWYAPAAKKRREEQRTRFRDNIISKMNLSREEASKKALVESVYPPALRNHPFIIVTQPRRIAAISLAKRVASELGEEVGKTVGFKIGHETMADKTKTRLLFVTSGWLLQKLVHNPIYLLECSHLVLDEIHERGVDADILYVILKRILRAIVQFDKKNNQSGFPTYPAMVLMSATFNTDLFGAYFASIYAELPKFRHYANPSNLRAIQIDTRRYPVAIFHLEQIFDSPVLKENKEMLNKLLPAENMGNVVGQLVQKMSKPPPPIVGGGSQPLGPVSNQLLHFISWLVQALTLVHRNDTDEGNCVLVFFPGLTEIEAAAQMIDEDLLKKTYPKKVRKDAARTKVVINEDDEEDGEDEEDEDDDAVSEKKVDSQNSATSKASKSRPHEGASNSFAAIDDEEDEEQADEDVDETPKTPSRNSSSGSSKEKDKTKKDGEYEIRQEPLSSIVELMILHSMCEDQLKVFDPVPAGITRVILATNIAESSVTIPYVKYVLDLGSHKEVEFNAKFQCEMLAKKFISQASAAQRAGRCGRLSPGTVFRLFPTCVFNNPRQMPKYDLPELLRVSLASTILRLKMTADSEEEPKEKAEDAKEKLTSMGVAKFDPSVCNLNDPHSVLSECMQPPDLSAIDLAYEELIKNGAVELKDANSVLNTVSRFQTSVPKFDPKDPKQKQALKAAKKAARGGSSSNESSDNEDEFFENTGMTASEKRVVYQKSGMTPLGRFFAALPFSFHLSRLVALGVVFGPRYLVHAVVISSALSMSDVFLMPMQSRSATGSGGGVGPSSGGSSGGPGSKKAEMDDPYPQFVAKTTKMRMWADAGIGSDAIAIVRVVDAYLKYRQYLSSEYGGAGGSSGIGRIKGLMNDWCAERGVHMKRIKSLTSSISEICYRLSGLVHQEEERDALLQLAAFCGKSKAKSHIVSTSRNGSTSSSTSSKDAKKTPQKKTKKHFSYNTPGQAAADRDSDRGNTPHADLFHLIDQTLNAGEKHKAYNHRADLLSTNTIPDDLLSLDPECVAILQFMLASALLPNLLIGTVAPANLGQGLPKPKAYGESKQEYMNPTNTYLIQHVPGSLMWDRHDTLEHRSEFSEISGAITEALKNGGQPIDPSAPTPKKSKNNQPDQQAMEPIGMVAFEFRETSKEQYTRYRVPLAGVPADLLNGPDNAIVPVLAMPTLEMLTLHRMFANGRLNILDRGAGTSNNFSSAAFRELNQPKLHVLTEVKLPGKPIKWRLFSPRSPARLDFLSPIASLTAYGVTVASLKKEITQLSDWDPTKVKAVSKDIVSEAASKKNAKLAAIQASQGKVEFQLFAVAASMTVSSGVQAEIRAEKVSLLPVGANNGLTSLFLALLLPGPYISTEESGLTGISFESKALHFPSQLPHALTTVCEKMRVMVNSLLSNEFVAVQPEDRKITPLFRKLIQPLIRSTVTEYPSTNPRGWKGVWKRTTTTTGGSSSSSATPARKMLVPSSVLSRTPETQKFKQILSRHDKHEKHDDEIAAAKVRHEQERQALVEKIKAKKNTSAASGSGTNSGSSTARSTGSNVEDSSSKPSSKPAPTQKERMVVARPASASASSTPAGASKPAAKPASAPSVSLSVPELLELLKPIFAAQPGGRMKSHDIGTLFRRVHGKLWNEVCPDPISRFLHTNIQHFVRDIETAEIMMAGVKGAPGKASPANQSANAAASDTHVKPALPAATIPVASRVLKKQQPAAAPSTASFTSAVAPVATTPKAAASSSSSSAAASSSIPDSAAKIAALRKAVWAAPSASMSMNAFLHVFKAEHGKTWPDFVGDGTKLKATMEKYPTVFKVETGGHEPMVRMLEHKNAAVELSEMSTNQKDAGKGAK